MPLAAFRIEFIGENATTYQRTIRALIRISQMEQYAGMLGHDEARPWVARLTGIDANARYVREFMRGQIDYSHANSVGSRGVYLHYALSVGLYEVNERTSWKHIRRHFVCVETGATSDTMVIREVTREWVDARLNAEAVKGNGRHAD